MTCSVNRDAHGTSYHIQASDTVKTPGGTVLPGVPALDIWWARNFKTRAEETLVIKQENMADRADVIELTFGQVYDMILALNKAVENT